MKFSVLIFLLLLATVCQSQQSFLIYQLKGNVQLKGSNRLAPVRIGQEIKSNNMLWLDKGASVVLICEGYSSFRINKRGDHLLVNYLDSCIREDHSVTARYFKYVWEEFTHPHTTPESNRRKFMQNTGAVVRGCPGITVEPIFDTVNNSTGDTKIKWKSPLPDSTLSFVLYDREKDGRLLYSTTVKNEFMPLRTIRKYSGDNEEVYWNIAINGNEMCSRKLVKFWQAAEYTAFRNDLTRSLNTISNKAERLFATGFLLEASHFIGEAKEYYKKAAALNPGEKRYRQAVQEIN